MKLESFKNNLPPKKWLTMDNWINQVKQISIIDDMYHFLFEVPINIHGLLLALHHNLKIFKNKKYLTKQKKNTKSVY